MKPFDAIEAIFWITDPAELSVLLPRLLGLGIRVRPAQSSEEFRAAIEEGGAELALAQITNSNREALQILAQANSASPMPPTIVICGNLDVDLYLEAMQSGAYDCIGTHLQDAELVRIISAALKSKHGCLTTAGGPIR